MHLRLRDCMFTAFISCSCMVMQIMHGICMVLLMNKQISALRLGLAALLQQKLLCNDLISREMNGLFNLCVSSCINKYTSTAGLIDLFVCLSYPQNTLRNEGSDQSHAGFLVCVFSFTIYCFYFTVKHFIDKLYWLSSVSEVRVELRLHPEPFAFHQKHKITPFFKIMFSIMDGWMFFKGSS